MPKHEAGQISAHAYMRARTKGNVPIRHSTEIELIRSLEYPFVPVRRPDPRGNRIPLVDFLTAYLSIATGPAHKMSHG